MIYYKSVGCVCIYICNIIFYIILCFKLSMTSYSAYNRLQKILPYGPTRLNMVSSSLSLISPGTSLCCPLTPLGDGEGQGHLGIQVQSLGSQSRILTPQATEPPPTSLTSSVPACTSSNPTLTGPSAGHPDFRQPRGLHFAIQVQNPKSHPQTLHPKSPSQPPLSHPQLQRPDSISLLTTILCIYVFMYLPVYHSITYRILPCKIRDLDLPATVFLAPRALYLSMKEATK